MSLGAVPPKGDELGRVQGGVLHAGQTTAACCAFHLSRFIRLPNVVKEQTRLMTGGHSAALLGTPEEVRSTELPGRLYMLCSHGAGCWGHLACVPCPFLLWPQALNWPAPPHTHTRGHVSVSGDMSAVTGRGCGTGTWQVEARGEHPAEHRTPHNGDTPNTNTASLRTTNSHCFSESS